MEMSPLQLEIGQSILSLWLTVQLHVLYRVLFVVFSLFCHLQLLPRASQLDLLTLYYSPCSVDFINEFVI